MEIDKDAIYVGGRWRIDKLVHVPKSVLFEKLEIDSASCVVEGEDEAKYERMGYDERMALEIPVRYNSIAYTGLRRSEIGSRPFIIPQKAYHDEMGLLPEFLKPEYYNRFI
jgi:CRISPR-associated endonuclease/helicase Cas3